MRLLRLPRTLARELRLAAGRRGRSLAGRIQRRDFLRTNVIKRAWARTDPHHLRRAIELTRGAFRLPPPAPPPAPGTEVTLTGELNPGRVMWVEPMLNDVDLDQALVSAMGIEPYTAPFPVEITVRVRSGPPSRSQRAVALADQVIAAETARRELERLCRQAGVPAELLLEEAAARAAACPDT